jgi:hypothetical protein
MEIDDSEKLLGTGDGNGLVKVWDISNYCLNLSLKEPLITTARKFLFVIKLFNI